MRPIHRAILCSSALLLLAAPPAAADDADAAALQKGKKLYDEAVVLLDAKKFEQACPKLEEAIRLVPVAVGARVALAECEEGRGHLATALAAYRKAQTLAAEAGQPDREKLARDRAAALSPRVATLQIAVGAADASLPELAVELDGRRLDAAERAAPLPLDAGKHAIKASAKGRDRFEAEVQIKDGDRASVTVVLPAPGAAPAPTAGPSASGAPPVSSVIVNRPALAQGPSPLRIAAIAGGALGVAAIGAGAGFGGLAISKNDESFSRGCQKGGQCPEAGAEARRAAYDAAAVSTGLFIGGGVLAAAGVVLFLVAPGKAPEKAPVTGMSLAFGPGSLTLRGGF
jgi:hypothetical protein